MTHGYWASTLDGAHFTTMRALVIASLVKDLPHKCEWGSALMTDTSPYTFLEGVPLTEDGFIDYAHFPVSLLHTLSDEKLLELYDNNACLRYR